MITTHLSADFDAFAAAVCAVRLYPDARVLFPGSQEAAVRRFLSEVAMPFPEIRLREARHRRLDHVVVVDTRSPRRLGEVWQLIERARCPVTVIDHHVNEPEQLGAGELISRPVGATCTIVASLLDERGLEPTAEEASLLLMGIYEDTGGLSYRETTPQDLRTVAWLLERGGSLEWVRRWVLKGLQPDQLELLTRIVEATEEVDVHGVPVSIALVEVDRYHEEAAYVVHRWMETFDIPVGVVMLVQPPHVNLILRSRAEGLHAGRVAQRFGGGGHPTAASARVTDRMPVELREQLLEALSEEMPPAAVAADVAASHIFWVDSTATVDATKDRINHLRVNALPVRDPATGEAVGTVTRQILDRAMAHKLEARPLAAVMQPGVPTVDAGTPLAELRDLFLERSYRFVIVERGGRPIGLITRMELFRRLFERQHAAGAGIDHRMAGARPVTQNVGRLVRESTPEWVARLLQTVKAVADTVGIPAFLVGGMVRDLLLGRVNEDVDLVVEGSGIDFAHALAAFTRGRCHPHEPFLTAVVTLPDGHRVDVASARTEFYRTPAALPEVETSLIRQDLYRRDFTVNALAVALHGDHHGQLVDFFGGRKDLQRREIRVLHSLSFIDDPTRAIRAVRYARRLGFQIAADTRHLVATAVGEGVFARLSGQRLRRELDLLLSEDHPAQSLAMLAELGLVPAIGAGLAWTERSLELLLELEGQMAWYELEQLGPSPPSWLLYLGALATASGEGVAAALAARLQLSGELGRRLATLGDAVAVAVAAGAPDVARSERARRIAEAPAEAVLLAMARSNLEAHRRLADALAVAVRTGVDVRGADLLAAGVPPGPTVGRAIRAARDAIVDGRITPAEAFDFALRAATASGAGEEPSR